MFNFRKNFASLADNAVTYTRKGQQVPKAPLVVNSHTKLASGLTVATADHKGPVSSLALVINAGSRFEHPLSSGIAQFWKQLLFRVCPR